MKHITIVVVLAAVSLCLFGRTALADDWTGPTTINVEMKGGKIITLKKLKSNTPRLYVGRRTNPSHALD